MINSAEKQGLIKPGVTTLIEPTSGNTAVALAGVAIHRGYRVAAVMPVFVSMERRMLLKALGADIYLTGADKMFYAYRGKALKLPKLLCQPLGIT
jgi:cysteine synthase A